MRKQGADPGKLLERSHPLKLTKQTFITIISYSLKNYIRDIRPFCLPLFCHSNVVKNTLSLLL